MRPAALALLTVAALLAGNNNQQDPKRVTKDTRRHAEVRYRVEYTITVYSDASLEFSPPTYTEIGDPSATNSHDKPLFPRQCTAIAKSTGRRCRNRALPGSDRCAFHQR